MSAIGKSGARSSGPIGPSGPRMEVRAAAARAGRPRCCTRPAGCASHRGRTSSVAAPTVPLGSPDDGDGLRADGGRREPSAPGAGGATGAASARPARRAATRSAPSRPRQTERGRRRRQARHRHGRTCRRRGHGRRHRGHGCRHRGHAGRRHARTCRPCTADPAAPHPCCGRAAGRRRSDRADAPPCRRRRRVVGSGEAAGDGGGVGEGVGVGDGRSGWGSRPASVRGSDWASGWASRRASVRGSRPAAGSVPAWPSASARWSAWALASERRELRSAPALAGRRDRAGRVSRTAQRRVAVTASVSVSGPRP